jgi:hydrogenase expression/formation protein HypC
MCIGIPMRVARASGESAWCEGRSGRRLIDFALVGRQPEGTWILAFLDSAREVLSEERALQINSALDALVAVSAGDIAGIDGLFPDLVGREPMLPEHLRKKGA